MYNLKNNANMKRPKQKNRQRSFVSGDLYLFHTTKRHCPARSSLWGIYDKSEQGVIYLESSTFDLQHFFLRDHLPSKYRYSRLATRAELRDYMYNMVCAENNANNMKLSRMLLSQIRFIVSSNSLK